MSSTQQTLRGARAGVLALLALTSCAGVIGADPAPVDGDAAGAPVADAGAAVAPSPLRRLTPTEYANTTRDLLGGADAPGVEFGDDPSTTGFDTDTAGQAPTEPLAENYLQAAEHLAAAAIDRVIARTACDPARVSEAACARAVIDDLAPRAYRRPLRDTDVARLLGVFDDARTRGQDYRTRLQLVVRAVLQSPHFLYRIELGEPTPGQPARRQLTSWELASRLSYTLWASMPDDALFAAAEADALRTPAQLAAQAQRMLAAPGAHDATWHFFEQWLDIPRVEGVSKDATTYPTWVDATGPLLERETQAFVDHVVFDDPRGDVATLLTANYTFLNGPLARFYGMTAGPGGDALEQVTLDAASQRAGVLTQASFLAGHASPDSSSPVQRGHVMRERLLCTPVPPPPPGVNTNLPDPGPTTTTRQRFEAHSADPSCSGCHHLMDPIGFGFEHFDGVGLFRTRDNGQLVDSSGSVTGSDVPGGFVDAAGLAAELAASQEVRACVVRQWFRYAFGRAESPDDEATLDALASDFALHGARFQDLFVAFVQTDAFRSRVVPDASTDPVTEADR